MPVVFLPGHAPKDDSGSEPPDNSDMLERIERLEKLAEKTGERLSAIETKLTKLETRADDFATKSDLYKAINEQTWKLITWTTGLGAALVGITFYIARNIK